MNEEYLKKIRKNLNNKQDKHYQFKSISKYFSKFLLTIILTILTLIILKANPKLKSDFYQKVYEDNFSFAYVNGLYEKYFGSSLPFQKMFSFLDTSTSVFSETLSYTKQEAYLDGVKIIVGDNYLIPCIETGLVIFVGEKEGYGNTVIIEQQDGVNVWYSNLESISVKLYDYVKKGSYIGENKEDYMFLVFKKEGNIVDYKNYI